MSILCSRSPFVKMYFTDMMNFMDKNDKLKTILIIFTLSFTRIETLLQ